MSGNIVTHLCKTSKRPIISSDGYFSHSVWTKFQVYRLIDINNGILYSVRFVAQHFSSRFNKLTILFKTFLVYSIYAGTVRFSDKI